ncbi:MAG: hypothetical protein QOG11_1315 [Solirubrobacteraceae bacterium]|nr:hypothetical protein [Solirubrobacteraceae bacterium]
MTPPALAVAGCLAAAGAAACGGAGGGSGTTASAPAAAGRPPAAALTTVPQLVGRRSEDAHRLARRAGLQLRWVGFAGKAANGRYEIGCVKVLRQSPVAGEQRPRGARVAIIEEACRTPKQAPHGV